MAADGGHCTLSPRTAQAVFPVLLQEISGSMLRGMVFALALVARVRECSSVLPYHAFSRNLDMNIVPIQ
jgi:hypothetical protein